MKQLLTLAGTALRSNFTQLKHPYKVTFCITYRCQSKCVTCNIWQIKPTNELSLEEIQKFAQKNSYFKWVQLTGGEPFLRSDIVDIARTFKESCKGLYLITMPTNSLCNPDLILRNLEEIAKLGIPRVELTVSLDGYRELHDKIRGIPGNYDRAINIFRRVSELRKRYPNLGVFFGYTMSKFNSGLLEKTIDEVRKDVPGVRFNDFHINLAQNSENYYKNENDDIRPDSEAAAREVEMMLKKREKEIGMIPTIERAFLKNLVVFARTNKSPMKSRALEASLYMDSWGNVFPSVMWNRKVGNIRETDYNLDGIWSGEEAANVRRDVREGKEPHQWTSCEAYQTLTGNVKSLIL